VLCHQKNGISKLLGYKSLERDNENCCIKKEGIRFLGHPLPLKVEFIKIK
jgi:hypothetical protein